MIKDCQRCGNEIYDCGSEQEYCEECIFLLYYGDEYEDQEVLEDLEQQKEQERLKEK